MNEIDDILKKINIEECYKKAFSDKNIKIVTFEDKEYPPLLKEIPDFYKLENYKDELMSLEGFGEKSISNLIEAIEVGNLNYLKKLPGVGPKAAGQIILDLKGQLRVDKTVVVKIETAVKHPMYQKIVKR